MNAARLYREVEVRAERTLSAIRMAVAGLLGLLALAFFVAVADAADEVVLRQLVFAAACMVASFAIGAAAWWMATPSRFRAWLPWMLTTVDVVFMLFMALFSAVQVGLPWHYLGALPGFTMLSLALSFAALRFNPMLAAYAVGLVTLAVLGDAVNVAARLEQATKQLGLPLLVTAEAIAAAGEHPAGWIWLPDQALRGREAVVTLYGLAMPSASV